MSTTSMDDALVNNTLPLTNEVSIQTEKTETSNTSMLFSKLDDLDTGNERKMIAMIYMMQIFFYRKAVELDTKYALDKEPELWVEMANIKGTYNNGWVTAFRIMGGVIQLGAGVIGVGAPFTQAVQKWSGISQALGPSAGFPTAISTILGEKNEANRSVYTFMQQTLQKKQEDRKRSSNEGEQKVQQLLNEQRQQEKEQSEVIRSATYN